MGAPGPLQQCAPHAMREAAERLTSRRKALQAERDKIVADAERGDRRLKGEAEILTRELVYLERKVELAAVARVSPLLLSRGWAFVDGFADKRLCQRIREQLQKWREEGRYVRGKIASGPPESRSDVIAEREIEDLRGTALEDYVRKADSFVSALAPRVRGQGAPDGWTAGERSSVMCSRY
eukprot:Hpha_TRINITY_DN14945_c0_g2::TRINITY_DN14945_c0_g2_i1::g.144741::m.144741